MKKAKTNYLALAVASAFLAAGCNGLQKMADNASTVGKKLTPDPLEMHAGKVPVSISVTFPPKYFDKKAYLIFTPILKSDNGSDVIKMRSQTLQGESIDDNNPMISYKNGGSYTYNDTLDYSDPFMKSTLELEVKATRNGESADVMNISIAKGVIVTPLLVEQGMQVDNGMSGDKGAGRTIDAKVSKPASSEQSQSLAVYYPMQKSNLDSKEQKKADVAAFVEAVKSAAADEKIQLKGIQVASYASPDGPEDMNGNLVEGRGTTSINFVKDQMKKAKVQQEGDFVTRQTTSAEDWEGFEKATKESELKDKELILRVLSMYSDASVREREIKNLSEAYTSLKSDVLPKLRRSEIKAITVCPEKTAEEIAQLAKENPDELSQEEAMWASANVNDLAAQENVLKNYISRYPNDWRGYNNLGNVYIKQNKLADAETNLNKAKELDANQSAIFNNLGVLALAQGDDAKAKEYFTQAKSMGGSEEAGYNLGVLNIKAGEYAEAVANFGSNPSFNKSLAQTLNGDNSAAQSTINSVNSDNPWVSYLKAVEAARGGDVTGVINNLKDACKDNACKEYAKKDAEFLKFIENDAVKALID